MSENWPKYFNMFSIIFLPIVYGVSLYQYSKRKPYKIATFVAILLSCINIGVCGYVEATNKADAEEDNNKQVPNDMWPSCIISALFIVSFGTTVFSLYYDYLFDKFHLSFTEMLDFIILKEFDNKIKKVIYSLLFIVCLICGIFLLKDQIKKGKIENMTKFLLSSMFILFMMTVALGLIKSEFENKYFTKSIKIMLYRKNITWVIFFVFFLSF